MSNYTYIVEPAHNRLVESLESARAVMPDPVIYGTFDLKSS